MSSEEVLKSKIEQLKLKVKTANEELSNIKEKNEVVKKNISTAIKERETLINSYKDEKDNQTELESLILEVTSLTEELERITSELKIYDLETDATIDPQLNQDPLYLSYMKNISELDDLAKTNSLKAESTFESIPPENDPHARLQYFKDATAELERENAELETFLVKESSKL